jgi:hypothetical protein
MQTNYNSIEKVDIDTLYTIDRERENTMRDPEFQQWCKDLRIGIMYTKRDGITRANDMMRQWTDEFDSGIPEWIRRMY